MSAGRPGGAPASMDRLLLDTHVFLWWRIDDPRLVERARNAIAGATIVLVSAASAWEAEIKAALGKLDLPEPLEVGAADSGFDTLSIGFSHARAAAHLPRHHADPFDRMLVAQAVTEGLTLVTHDRRIEPYDVPVLWT
jgi:PIN domain nuclease of toxin-antitoxin system